MTSTALSRFSEIVHKVRAPETSDALQRAVEAKAKGFLEDMFAMEKAQGGTELPAIERQPMTARQAAVRLVTFVEARLRGAGFVTAMSALRVDHAITVSVDKLNFCTVSAVDGEVYVDAAGPAPVRALPLRYDTLTEMFWPMDEREPLDPCAVIEREMAKCAPFARATQVLLNLGAYQR